MKSCRVSRPTAVERALWFVYIHGDIMIIYYTIVADSAKFEGSVCIFFVIYWGVVLKHKISN